MVEDKSFSKILEWMEQIGKEVREIKEFVLDLSQKFETLFEVVQEVRDDMRLIKRTVNVHDDDIRKVKEELASLSKHLHP